MYRGVLAASVAFFACASAQAVVGDLTFEPGTYQLISDDGLITVYKLGAFNLIGTGRIANGVYRVNPADALGQGGFSFFNQPAYTSVLGFDLRGEGPARLKISGSTQTISLSGSFQSFGPYAGPTREFTIDSITSFAEIDNISFDFATSVPEPATWAMMIAGFGLVGAASRQNGRKRSAGMFINARA